MGVDAANARIFGSDDDAVWINDLGSTMPTGLAAPATGWEDVGWLHTDGIPFTPSDSVTKFRGHQGGRVIRTKMTESDTTFQFQALESKLLTLGLQFNIKAQATATGVHTLTLSSGRRVIPKALIVDVFDEDDTDLQWRFEIPRGEIGERSEFTLSNSDITGYTFPVEIIGDWFLVTNDPAFAAA